MIVKIARYPVKSMLGEDVRAAELTVHGIGGDRRWALIDSGSGRVVSAKHPRKWSRTLHLAARADEDGDAVTITFPDGEVVSSRDDGIDAKLSAYLGHAVHLCASPAGDVVIERADPVVGGVFVPEDKRTAIVTRMDTLQGTFFDYAPLHLVTVATLERLQSLAPGSRFDPARFRPNLVVDLPGGTAFAENHWAGMSMHIGSHVVLRLDVPTPRCAIPTLAQGDLPKDQEVVRQIAHHNRITIAGKGTFACLGLYAWVVRTGEVAVGDPVRLK